MRECSKGRTLVARDEGDDANGVVVKLYGERLPVPPRPSWAAWFPT